ncbi:tRNA (guanosine(46)-N7)-methyltransferase TrmB [Aquisediminimonas sediminicola]|uniref:tRNA (guanosine(46)-N7)-methyltransferase TrmB n=1 Tax=Alteraquisediminimonas sediminicola TaxID=2676787 RepID=UPI001C8EF60F|nr:tRNA (guanosine(46)-N7)-methyltransferase TrmB [Aquisediminimonas sediminicola]
MNDPTTLNRLYGRRAGHKLRKGQQQLIDELLPQVAVPDGPLDSQTLFGDDRPLHLEIGFGAGEHLAGQAMMRPDHGFIGCEPFLNGVVGALLHIDENELTNVRLHMGDALDVLSRLPDASLDRAYLLHPDPWPKARHAKRRMMNPGPLDRIAAKLKPGGEFRFGTDHPIYVRWAMMQMGKRTDFEWQIDDCRDFQVRPDDWPETRYERKARRIGHEVWYFRYIRV